MTECVAQIVERTLQKRPMVHSITNNVTVNDCANIILAAGGSAIMAQDEREVAEITSRSDALSLNMGALRAQEAMLLSAHAAKRRKRPVILDPVAAGASRLRGEMCARLLEAGLVSVVRGNASEVWALMTGAQHTLGVEVNALDQVTEQNLSESARRVSLFSRETGAVVLLSGALDIVSDGKCTAVLRGGSEMMRRITGAGCMLTSLTAAYCGANPENLFEAAVAASGVMKTCGELAYRRVCEEMEGTASFRTRLIDAVSMQTGSDLAAKLRVQIL